MESPSGAFNISAFVQKDDVDNRIALRIYYMIADCFLRRADSYREEKNIILLYIMLMKFSSLMSETIPCHRDYPVSLKRERLSFEKKLLNSLTELETLKPTVQSLIEEQNRKRMKEVAKSDQVQYPSNLDLTPVDADMPSFVPVPIHCFLGPNGLRGQWQPPSTDSGVQYPSNLDLTSIEMPTPVDAEMPSFVPVPIHRFLGPNGLRGPISKQLRLNFSRDANSSRCRDCKIFACPKTLYLRSKWASWSVAATFHDRGVQYPSNLDLTPVEIEMPSLIQPAEDEVMAVKDSGDSESERSIFESVLSLNDGRWSLPAEEPCTSSRG